MAEATLSVSVKLISGTSFSIEVPSDIAIEELRTRLVEQSGIPADQQRLVYSGRILKDGQTLASYGFKSNHALHLVKAASNKASAQAAQVTQPPMPSPSASTRPPMGTAPGSAMGGAPTMGGMPGMQGMNPEMLATLLDNPMMQSMLSNPDTVRSMMMANPQTRQMMENYPEMAQMMADPEVIRQSLEMARNPALRTEMMRQQDRAFSNIEAMPGGFQHLSRMHQDLVEPMMDAVGSRGQSTQPDLSDNPFASLLQAPEQPSPPQRNTEALPNPWAAPTPTRTQATAPPALGNPFAGLLNPATSAPAGEEDLYGTGQSTAAPPPSSAPTPPNMFGAGMGMDDPAMMQMMETMMDSPLMAQQLQSMASNPEALRSMLDRNPMTASNPMLRAHMETMLSQPEALQTALNPDNVRRAMRLRRMMSNPAGLSAEDTALLQEDMARLGTAHQTPSGTTPTTTLPSQPSVAPAVQYRVQLQQLGDMGFTDEAANVQALQATNGNVHLAVQRLLG
eukprot:m.29209 g.29209  ORF g.29209 m.29209 type:complete len:508 (-) comp11932_c0_seq1:49-1572(-)